MVIEFYAAASQVFEVPDISITLAGLFHQPGLRPKPSVRFYLNFLTGKQFLKIIIPTFTMQKKLYLLRNIQEL